MTLHLTDFQPGDRLTVTRTDDPTTPVGVPGTVKRIAEHEGFLSVRFDGMTWNLPVLPGSDTLVRLCPACGFVDDHTDCGGCVHCEGGACATCGAGAPPEYWAGLAARTAADQASVPASLPDDGLDALRRTLNQT